MNNKDLMLQLKEEHNLPLHAWQTLISTHTAEDAQFAADTCREAGMVAAATAAELGGRILALLQALPLLQELLDCFAGYLQ